MRWLLLAFGAVVGCYSPGTDPACLTACDPAFTGQPNACPGSLVCMSDGKCHASDGSCGTVTDDADVLVDVRPDDSTPFCYGGGMLRICLQGEPSDAWQMGETAIDTTACAGGVTISQDDGPELCVFAYEIVALDTVQFVGTRSVVVIGTQRIQMTGTISVASKGGIGGAANSPSSCPQQNGMIGTGGNGGSFGTSGGRGGFSMVAAPTPIHPSILRGGCPGALGPGGTANPGGLGGGAIYFISDGEIVVNGTINASGAGGSGGTTGGGGGGGAGGMVGLDSPLITATGSVFALGGGGGGGGLNGGSGGDAVSYTDIPAGGAPGTSGGLGGAGYSQALPAQGGGAAGSFGGGGGGGAGIIRIYPASQAAAFDNKLAPPPAL